MTGPPVTYLLKAFKSSLDPDFVRALQIYGSNTAAFNKTNTNEIALWLDVPSEDFRGKFSTFGFYRNKELVGFAETAFLETSRLFVIDYVVIDTQYRHLNVFTELAAQLRSHLEDTHPDCRYVAAEISYGRQGLEPSEESRLLIRLLKFQGFHVVVAPYYQPRLELGYAESEMRCDLMLFSWGTIHEIKRETFLEIVRSIYYDYYLLWMVHAGIDGPEYKKHLDALFARIKSQLKSNKPITVNGHSLVLPAVSTPTPKEDRRVLGFALKGGALVVTASVALLAAKALFHASDQAFEATYLISLGVILGMAGIISKEARKMFSELFSSLRAFYRQEKSSMPSVRQTARPALPSPDEQQEPPS